MKTRKNSVLTPQTAACPLPCHTNLLHSNFPDRPRCHTHKRTSLSSSYPSFPRPWNQFGQTTPEADGQRFQPAILPHRSNSCETSTTLPSKDGVASTTVWTPGEYTLNVGASTGMPWQTNHVPQPSGEYLFSADPSPDTPLPHPRTSQHSQHGAEPIDGLENPDGLWAPPSPQASEKPAFRAW
jgi:hypothetical protein